MYSAADDSDPVRIPVVPGAAHGHGVPELSTLPLTRRALVASLAGVDIAVRTVLSSMISTAMLGTLIASTGRRLTGGNANAENLNFYIDMAARHDASASFPRPEVVPDTKSRNARLVAHRPAAGAVANVTFVSSFRPLNPAMHRKWRGMVRNNVVSVQHWRHHDGPRPTLCIIHGFGAAAYLANSLAFALPMFYRGGYDVVLYTLPFHGPRAEKYSPFSGYGYYAHGVAGLAEAMAQAVHDFRSTLDYLERTGVTDVAVTGMSLGAYTASLLAAVEPRLRAVMPIIPVVSPELLIDSMFPLNKTSSLIRRVSGTAAEDAALAAAYHSPLNYPPLIDARRGLIVAGLGDRVAPPSQAELLWHHWDHCALHWFPGNHLIHAGGRRYRRRMIDFLDALRA